MKTTLRARVGAWLRLCGAYLSARRWILLALPLACGVFWLVLSLFRLPVQAVGYAAALCAAAGLIALVLDGRAFLRRHRQLVALRQHPSAAVELLPAPRDLLEADYQALLQAAVGERQALQAQTEQRFRQQSDYFTMWAHQIKTPIAAAQLLLQSEELPAARELRDELQRIEQYAGMVLGYLRLDSSSTDYVIGWGDLDHICRAAVRKYASQFIRRGLRLIYEPPACRVLTDEKWLGFVVEQLLSNALKYTRSGSITLRLEAPCTLCIQDTGIGIAPEDLPRVCEMGYTGSNGRLDQRATGIGLYLCRRITQQLGHSLDITSRPGQGTTVRIGLDSAQFRLE